MKTLTLGTLVLAATLFACSGGADDGDPAGGSPGTGSESSPTAPGTNASSGAAPEYSISCHGDVSKKTISVGASTLCIGGEPGTFCGDDPCATAQIEIRYEPPATKCGSVDVWAWDGSACKAYPTNNGGTMKCKGTGCEKLYKSEAACKEAYASCAAK